MSHGNGPLAVVILAAGQGKRMKSRRAKVLHELCGVPLVAHVLRVARQLEPSRLVVVIGRDAERVEEVCGAGPQWIVQEERRGTGHAVQRAEPALRDVEGDVLILYGDTPLLRSETLLRMRTQKRETRADLVMLTAEGDIPGRVVRDDRGRVRRIVEAQDANEHELAIAERNTGVYLVSRDVLFEGLANLRPNNAQAEIYLTDIVGYAVGKGRRVETLALRDAEECLGINTRVELAHARAIMQHRINEGLMASGVTLVDPECSYIDASVRIGRDTLIEPGCVITGQSVIGENVHIKANCYIEDSQLADDVIFGPFAHLRPNCRLERGVKVGNFVEVKNATLGPGTKSAHLTYIGDASVGANVNFGCGSVVVNYDGYSKHRSTVGDGAFIGCNVNLISPVEIEPKAFLAAGSTIDRDVPPDALAIARMRQRNLLGWVARKEGRVPASAEGEAPERSAGEASREKSGEASVGAAKPGEGDIGGK